MKDRILTYGLDSEERNTLIKLAPSCEIIDTDCSTDLIALPAELLIVRPSRLIIDDISMLVEYYRECSPSNVALVLLEEDTAFFGLKNVYVKHDLLINSIGSQQFIIGRLHDTKKDYDFSRRLANILRLNRHIIAKPGITTKELAKIEEVSDRTIRRMIDTLNMSGAVIEHLPLEKRGHSNLKGWFCKEAVWDIGN